MKDSRRLFLFRPHIGPWYTTPLRKAIKKQRVAVKYKYILECENVKYLAFLKIWRLSNINHNIKEILHIFLWCLYYKKNPLNIKFSLNDKDVLFFYHHGNCSNVFNEYDNELVTYLKELNCRKICHLTHFQYGLASGISNLDTIKPDLLVGEANPFKNMHWSHEKKHSHRFRLLPFAVSEKFYRVNSDLGIRENRVVLTGTIAPRIDDMLFVNTYGTDCLQPERITLEKISEGNQFYENMMSNNYNESRRLLDKQSEYFKLDITQVYTKFKFSIVTKEIVGFPAIGMFEAMAAGCIIIFNDKVLMNTYGLVDNVHYIHVEEYSHLQEKLSLYSEASLKEIQSNSISISKSFSESAIKEIFRSIIHE
ncbi:TPA: hypothetical protein RQK43_003347 [Vibrio vulnificus]|nr:hypothetical protein [Vibrio vulnificus]HDY7731343.1 hypothetical protein [Vibrio vulnificus]HDY7863588.1 hypothetical protein [Vibrio vulnificus]HDY7877450.1 hypothetical protein [Vibrio vulnificus]HDY8090952.1 hypothetical protein [Vibrio vulnificus]